MQKIKLILYYMVVQNLPHSRLSMLSNKIRVWYCKRILGFVKDVNFSSKFENNIYVSDSTRLEIGTNCRINEYSFFQGDIEIGSNVLIAPYVSVYSETHEHSRIDIPILDQGVTPSKKVVIEDDVWIGRNVIILPGVKIGRGSIVGANSVVNRDLKPGTVNAGAPCKFIKNRV